MNWTSQSPWIPHESKNNVMLKFAGYCLIKMGRWVFDGVLVRYSYLVLSDFNCMSVVRINQLDI
jgi:hypothetical protein